MIKPGDDPLRAIGLGIDERSAVDFQDLELRARELLRAAPYGVGYFVGVWVLPSMTLRQPQAGEIDGILDRVDGLLVSGSRTNVHPSLYGKEGTDAEGPYDRLVAENETFRRMAAG
mgnify:CR=1 FL=1